MDTTPIKTAAHHTPEPWKMDWHFIVAPDPKGIYPDIYIGEIAEEDSSEPPRVVSPDEQRANGRRIVAAVNACQGIPTEALEQGIVQEMRELLERAIVELEEWHIGFSGGDDSSEEALTLLHMALEKVRGNISVTAPILSVTDFDGDEIAPVREEAGSCKACTPSEAHVWTRYSPIPDEGAEAINATPFWMKKIYACDALEIHPVRDVEWNDEIQGLRPFHAKDDPETYYEQCDPHEAHFWSVYGHRKESGLDCFEDFATEAEARSFAARLLSIYPHLKGNKVPEK